MKKIVFLIILATCASFAQSNFEKPTAELFMPKFFQDFPNVRDITVSNNQKEMYFTVLGFRKEFSFIAVTRFENENWTKPEVASFSGTDKDLEPFLSPDNLKLYFASNRRIAKNKERMDFDIWVVQRSSIASKWSNPRNIGPTVNSDDNEFYPAVGSSGNLYFTATIKGDTKGKEDIYMSLLVDGTYTKPKSLSEGVNSETYEFNAYVSPNEDILLFSSYKRADSFGGVDLYISRKDENGNWTIAKNLGKTINSDKIDYCPFLDLNSNTLYFTSEKSLQSTKFDTPKTIDEILNHFKSFPNGMSRIFIIESFENHID